MRTQLFIMGVGLTALLAACGGGGGEGGATGAVASTLSFPAASAYTSLIANGMAAKNFAISGSCSGTATMTRSATVGGATFEGVTGRLSALSTVNMNLTNCTPTSSTSNTTSYYDTNYIPLGTNTVGGDYGVYLTPPSLPSSVTVGSTGPFGTLTYYANSTKATVTGQLVESYAIEPDTTTTAIVNLIAKNYNASSVLTFTEQDRYRIAMTGAPVLLSVDVQYADGSLHLVFQ